MPVGTAEGMVDDTGAEEASVGTVGVDDGKSCLMGRTWASPPRAKRKTDNILHTQIETKRREKKTTRYEP